MSFFEKKEIKQDINQSFAARRRHILNENSSFYVKESYKTLRTNIRFFLSGEGCKKFCITSGVAGEGKSITILNLAISFAQTGQRVLLMDADMRRPSMGRLLVEKTIPGLSNVLAGFCTEQDAIRRNVYPNLDIMFAGEIPPNPSELLGNQRMKLLIDRLSTQYDYILVDTPPVGIVSDACVVATLLDGVLFLVRQRQSEKEIVAKGVRQLEISGARLMGFVLNGTDGKNSKYKYRYSYESTSKVQKDKKAKVK